MILAAAGWVAQATAVVELALAARLACRVLAAVAHWRRRWVES